MSRTTLGAIALWSGVLLSGYTGVASGQGWYPAGQCGCAPPPITAAAACQPVAQYTMVPVTEYRECRQTVQRPVVDTKYVDQQFTEYRPLTETKTAQIPSVTYQAVTECQTRTRDAGQWVTNYSCRPTMAPCEYDSRPGMIGSLNRQMYSMRMAFTPKVTAQRTYVPNMITENIPVTRQVPITTMREVNYQVTKMVPYTSTRKVAVNTVRMVAEEVVTRQPVTVMRSVPVGSAMAYGPFNSRTAVVPVPDPLSSARVPARTATPITPVPSREANAAPINGVPRPTGIKDDDDAFERSRIDREASPFDANSTSVPTRRSSLDPSADDFGEPNEIYRGSDAGPTAGVERTSTREVSGTPSAVRVTQWVSRRRATSTPEPQTDARISVAETNTRVK